MITADIAKPWKIQSYLFHVLSLIRQYMENISVVYKQYMENFPLINNVGYGETKWTGQSC